MPSKKSLEEDYDTFLSLRGLADTSNIDNVKAKRSSDNKPGTGRSLITTTNNLFAAASRAKDAEEKF